MENIKSEYSPVPKKNNKSNENSIEDNSTVIDKNDMTDIKISSTSVRSPIDIQNNRYPFCIVWTPLPLISWIIPIIGHTGICTSDGKIHDFAGSYYIGVNNMAFGNPYKYIQMNPNIEEHDQWDEAIYKSDEKFSNEEHNICLNNCHSHVAYALNTCNYKKPSNYNMIHIWWMFLTKSKYTSYSAVLKTYIGFAILVVLVCLILRIN